MARRVKTNAETVVPEQQFLRLMSHEMRTPLNGVIGMLGLLSRTRLDGAQRAYAEAARSSAEHLLVGHDDASAGVHFSSTEGT